MHLTYQPNRTHTEAATTANAGAAALRTGVFAEPTSEMVSAGVAVYRQHCPDSCDGGRIDRVMIEKVLRAALRLMAQGPKV